MMGLAIRLGMAVLPKSVRAIGSYDPAKLGAVENAFKWPETSRPATNIDANDPRHIWRHAPDGKSCPKPAHPPAVAPLPAVAADKTNC